MRAEEDIRVGPATLSLQSGRSGSRGGAFHCVLRQPACPILVLKPELPKSDKGRKRPRYFVFGVVQGPAGLMFLNPSPEISDGEQNFGLGTVGPRV